MTSNKKKTGLSRVLTELFAGGRRDRSQEERLLRLVEINNALNSELNLKRLLNRILDAVIELFGAERGFVIVRKEGRNVVEAARNFDREEIRRAESKVSSGIVNRVMEERKAVLSDSAMEDKELSRFTSVADLKLRSVLCTPLKAKDRVIGCIYMDNRFQRGSFTEQDRALLELFSDQAAIAVANARLYEENERARGRMEELNRALQERVAQQADQLRTIRDEAAARRESLELKYDYSSIVGRSPAMLEVFRLMDLVTDTDYPVLVCGESGTGKELVARAVHRNGPRGEKPFVSQNCAAITETLLESELFGYEKGAFTGADRRKTGLFEQAHGGTLFLDEIGDMEPTMQKKLLRVLQEGEIRRVGGRETIPVDVRIISATNADLAELIEKGRFREDLYYRLKVMTIRLPPLRERREDIPLLARSFLARIAEERGEPRKEISPEALRVLVAYPWPGNVRELRNEMQRLALVSGEIIRKEDVADLEASPPPARGRTPSFRGRTLEEIEREAILAAVEEAGGNKALAARMLNIPRRTLYNRLKKYGLL